MFITLIKNERIFGLVLPVKKKGQFWVHDEDAQDKHREIINIEANGDEWLCRSTRSATILDEANKPIPSSVLLPLSLLPIKVDGEESKSFLFCEPITLDRKKFGKYSVIKNQVLSIGRAESNSIIFINSYVSTIHASLEFSGEEWIVTDKNSRNGTFINGKRISVSNAKPGDVIFIMGLKIVLGKGFVSLNNPDNKVKIDEKKLQPWCSNVDGLMHSEATDDDLNVETEYFYRSPRIRRDIQKSTIKIDLPPSPQNDEKVPLSLMLGPSITMGIASMATALITLSNAINNNGNISQVMPTMMMSLSMMLGTILWPTLTKRFEKRQRILNEEKRVGKYRNYLVETRTRIENEKNLQREIVNENYVSPSNWTQRVLQRERNLWERTNKQPDFLHLRLGVGSMPLMASIEAPEDRFSLDQDPLKEEMYSLVKEPKIVDNVPIILSLVESNIVGVIGDSDNLMEFVKTSTLQLASLHSYDEVKMVFLMNDEGMNRLDYLRILPHVWSDERNIRYFASSMDELRELSAELEKVFRIRKENGTSDLELMMPRFIIFGLDRNLVEKSELIKSILKENEDLGFTLLSFSDSIKYLPKECKAIVEVTKDVSTIYDKEDISGKKISFKSDICSEDGFLLAKSLANIQLDLSNQRYTLPTSLPFLDLFGVGKIEHLNSLTRWKESNPTLSLQTSVGVGTDGEEFLLDLHEKHHGPHGLIAGMTGSGKSEFIITYILSLSVNYHPNEVGFILIDYKGGGLAGAFENKEMGIRLPHLMGTITNLDGASIKRSLISIQSELRRRQVIFSEARRLSNEGTMDIYKYQRLYREGKVEIPLPHLFIISDEFAELKTQQSEFMEQLISAARIGRSLGIHLILATQKPSGVVDDQIWSNSRFRVCLKVQEKADSMEIIKHPDAAELKVTGRFYLQVGYNEIYELGQSAWSGETYVPSDKPIVKVDDSVKVIDHLGRTVREVVLSKKADNKNNPKQIVSVVKYLSDMAKEENFTHRSLWLDEIPPIILIDELKNKYKTSAKRFELIPVVGEYDDPFNQCKHPLSINISEDGNLALFGASGSGKEMFLNVLIYSLLKDHAPDEVNLYIIDLGSESLKSFESAPHIGEIMLSDDEEKIESLLKQLKEEVVKRKALLRETASSVLEYNTIVDTPLPHIMVIISNYSSFAELFPDFEQDVMYLTREGNKYGITFVVTANTLSSIKYKIQQNFKQQMTLQQNDVTDYSTIVGSTEGLYPSHIKGRGLVHFDRVYEFQTASIVSSGSTMKFIKEFCEVSGDRHETRTAKIRTLPDQIHPNNIIESRRKPLSVPIGMSKRNLEVEHLYSENDSIQLAYCHTMENGIRFITGLSHVLDILTEYQATIIDPLDLLPKDQTRNIAFHVDEVEKVAFDIYQDVLVRNNTYKDSGMDLSSIEDYPQRLVVIFGVSDFLSRLNEDLRQKINEVLNRSETFHKVRFLLVDHQDGYKNYILQPWYKKSTKIGNDLWIGEGITNQNCIQNINGKHELEDEVPNNMGYMMRNAKPQLLRLVEGKVK